MDKKRGKVGGWIMKMGKRRKIRGVLFNQKKRESKRGEEQEVEHAVPDNTILLISSLVVV